MDTTDSERTLTRQRVIRVGQSIGIGIFVLSLIVGALMFVLFEGPVNTVHDTANDTLTNQTALNGVDNSVTIFDALPIIFMAVGAVGTIVWAVFSADIR